MTNEQIISKMKDDMKMRGFSHWTEESYLGKTNDMLGFCKNDVQYLMDEIEIDEKTQEKLLPIIKTNYDGYIFSNMIKDDLDKYKI